MRHGSLFSGIGGFDLAAEWMGWENVFQVEIDPFCQKVLKKNFPNVTRYGDIKEFDGTKYRGAIDIISGGFPCQPYSSAGQRKGKSDDRHLWPQMLRVISEIQPRYIVGENVLGIIDWNGGMVFEQIQTDLENEGFEVIPVILPACGKNLFHIRSRTWFIAHSPSKQSIEAEQEISRGKYGQEATGSTYGTWLEAATELCGVAHGVPDRVDRIKGLGNAIVPQIAFEIFKAIEATGKL